MWAYDFALGCAVAPNKTGVFGTSLSGSELASAAIQGATNGLSLNASGSLGLGPYAIQLTGSHDFTNGLKGGTIELSNQIDWSFHADANYSASLSRTWYSNPSVAATYNIDLGIGLGAFASVDVKFGSTGPHFWNWGFSSVTTDFGAGAGAKFDIDRTSTISSGSVIVTPQGDIHYEHHEPGDSNNSNGG